MRNAERHEEVSVTKIYFSLSNIMTKLQSAGIFWKSVSFTSLMKKTLSVEV